MTDFKTSGGRPWQKGLRCFCHTFTLSTHYKYDFIHSLIAIGRPLGCFESVISHYPLYPVKLSTEFCMPEVSLAHCVIVMNLKKTQFSHIFRHSLPLRILFKLLVTRAYSPPVQLLHYFICQFSQILNRLTFRSSVFYSQNLTTL